MALVGLGIGAFAGYITFLYYSSFPEVLMSSGTLIVRNEAGDRVIPISSIRAVRESRWSRTKRIIVEFENSTARIERIEFIPDYQGHRIVHPLVQDLRHLAGLQK